MTTRLNWRWRISSLFYRFSYIELAHQLDEDLFAYLGDRVKDAVVVDCGCGPGIVTEKFAERGASRIFAVDVNEAMLQQMRHRLSMAGMYDRVIEIRQSFTPALFIDLRQHFLDGDGFDVVLFKRSLYLPPEQALPVLKEAVASLNQEGLLILIHGDRSWRNYVLGPDGKPASYSPFHFFNRVVSLLGAKSSIGTYKLYSGGELESLLTGSFPQHRVEQIPSQQKAYNLFAVLN